MDELSAALSRPDLPSTFQRWRVVITPGAERVTDAAEWAGAVVLVECGALEVDCDAGGRRTFAEGALLALGWLPLRLLRNPGAKPTRLLAVRRRERPPTQAFLHIIRATSTEAATVPLPLQELLE